jgi:hypothetical protein
MPDSETKFENERVRVSEVIHEPGVPRESYIRLTDQVIVFMDDCRYERVDFRTGDRVIRERKSGDFLWHPRGEEAPVLINRGSRPYRTVVIEIKQ